MHNYEWYTSDRFGGFIFFILSKQGFFKIFPLKYFSLNLLILIVLGYVCRTNNHIIYHISHITLAVRYDLPVTLARISFLLNEYNSM